LERTPKDASHAQINVPFADAILSAMGQRINVFRGDSTGLPVTIAELAHSESAG
jgi:hypothetical protein